MSALLTIVIPTYNRPEQLAKTVRLLRRHSPPLPIIVADGSYEEYSSRNATCREIGTDIEYFQLPSEPSEIPLHNYGRRVRKALAQCTTPYTAICADDDLLIPENAIRAAEFLEDNPQYVGCHGHYLQFEYAAGTIKTPNVEYQGPSIDANEIGARLIQLFSQYEALFYAVFRTNTIRVLMEQCQKPKPPLWPEIYHSTSAVVAGKIHRNNAIFCLRNIGDAPHHSADSTFVNFGQWIAADFDGFLEHYRKYRACVLDWSSPNADPHNLRRTIDLAFITYIGSEFDRPYWIDRCAETVIGTDERDKLRARLKSNLFGRRAGPEPFYSIKHVGWQLCKSILGRQAMSFVRNVRNKGLAGAIERARKTRGGWTTVYESHAGHVYGVDVAPWLVDHFPDEQWSLLGGIEKSG
jgi:glycosyltransferase domain-containing protein